MSDPGEADIAAVLAKHPPAIAEIANRVRFIVKEIIPEREERPYAGWHAIGFVHPQAGYFCGIFPTDDEVTIVFEHGRALSDPKGILQGDYKQIRIIPIHKQAELAEIESPFRALLLESIDVGRALRAKKRTG